jgi:uncharacterized membrane protein
MFIRPYYMAGNIPYEWLWSILWTVFLAVMVGMLVRWSFRRGIDQAQQHSIQHGNPQSTIPTPPAEEVARQRFAKGEITQEELHSILDTLKSSRNQL